MRACSSTPRSCRRGRSSTSSGPSWRRPPTTTPRHRPSGRRAGRRRRGRAGRERRHPRPLRCSSSRRSPDVHLIDRQVRQPPAQRRQPRGRRPDPRPRPSGRRLVCSSAATPLSRPRTTLRSGSTSKATPTRSTPWREVCRRSRRAWACSWTDGSSSRGCDWAGSAPAPPSPSWRPCWRGWPPSRPTSGGRPASRCSPPSSTVPTSRAYKIVAEIPLGPHVVH